MARVPYSGPSSPAALKKVKGYFASLLLQSVLRSSCGRKSWQLRCDEIASSDLGTLLSSPLGSKGHRSRCKGLGSRRNQVCLDSKFQIVDSFS